MQLETRYLPAEELRVVTADDKRPRIVGYGIVFNVKSELISDGGRRFREIIAPESVVDVLAPGADIRALVNHDRDKVLGRTKPGTLRYQIDDHGVRVDIDPPDTSYARDAVESIRRGDMSGMSFEFRVAKDGYSWTKDSDGVPLGTVQRMEVLREFSVVTFPAYPATSAAIRSLQEFEEQEAQAVQEARRRALPLDAARRRLRIAEAG